MRETKEMRGREEEEEEEGSEKKREGYIYWMNVTESCLQHNLTNVNEHWYINIPSFGTAQFQ